MDQPSKGVLRNAYIEKEAYFFTFAFFGIDLFTIPVMKVKIGLQIKQIPSFVKEFLMFRCTWCLACLK